MDEDDKFYAVEASHPHGFKILMKLLMQIYRDEGYFKRWTDKDAVVFAGKKAIAVEDVQEVVATAVEYGFFSRELFEEHEILTSAGIQRRYIRGCEGRSRIIIEQSYALVGPEEFPEKVKKHLEVVFSEITTKQAPSEGVISEKPPQKPELNPQTRQDKKTRQETRQDEMRRDETTKSDGGGVFSEITGAGTNAPTDEAIRAYLERSGGRLLPGLDVRADVVRRIREGLEAEFLGMDYLAWVVDEISKLGKDNPGGYFLTYFLDESRVDRWRKQQRRLRDRSPPTSQDEKEQLASNLGQFRRDRGWVGSDAE